MPSYCDSNLSSYINTHYWCLSTYRENHVDLSVIMCYSSHIYNIKDTQYGSLNHVLRWRGYCKTAQGYLNNLLIFILNFNIYLYTLLLVLSNKSLQLIVFIFKWNLILRKKAIGNFHCLAFVTGVHIIFFIFWLTTNQTIFYIRLIKDGT